MSTEVVINDQRSVAVQQSPSDGLLAVIAQVSRDQSVDVSKLERLLDMQMQVIKFQRESEFNEALARVQAQMPQLDQNGRIDYNKPGVKPIPYALLEDIDAVIRPIYSAEGFAVAWDSKQSPNGDIEVIGDFKHRGGHTERRTVYMPKDTSGGKNSAQGVVSTISYGRRTLLKMFFNLIEKSSDTNGSDLEKIDARDVDSINDLLASTGSDKARFLSFMGVNKVEDIFKRDAPKAFNALNNKARRS